MIRRDESGKCSSSGRGGGGGGGGSGYVKECGHTHPRWFYRRRLSLRSERVDEAVAGAVEGDQRLHAIGVRVDVDADGANAALVGVDQCSGNGAEAAGGGG